MSRDGCGVVHFSGGNHFNDMRLDISKSHANLRQSMAAGKQRPVLRRNRLTNWLDYFAVRVLVKTRWIEPLVTTGVFRKWFDEFHAYWQAIEGRPLALNDFHLLNFSYRTRAQYTQEFNWDSHAQHLANWQTPDNISATFQYTRYQSLHPIRTPLLSKYLKNRGTALEFGCSLAPVYRTYARFLNHRRVKWVLADIPNFPFHYTRFLYEGNEDCQCAVISEDRFDDPLKENVQTFDFIVIQEVFEHLHSPRKIAEYLLQRLNPDGYFMFDYMHGEGGGHDTLAGREQRVETLKYLGDRLRIVEGKFHTKADESLSLCVGALRA